MSRDNFETDGYSAIMERIAPVTGIKSPAQMSKIIKIPQSTISRKKKSNQFEVEWAYRISRRFNISIDWILTGEERKLLVSQNKNNGYKDTEMRDRGNFFKEIVRLQEWLFEVCEAEPARRNWFKVELMDKFPIFASWLKDKEIKEAGREKQEFVSSGDNETVT